MSIIFQNSRKNQIKVDNEKIIKSLLFLNDFKFIRKIDIFGVNEFVFEDKKEFQSFRQQYEDDINHLKFVSKYRSGAFDHMFEK